MFSLRYTLVVLVFTILLTSCDQPGTYSGLQADTRSELMSYAGVLARYWVLPESDPRHPGSLQEEYIAALTTLCDTEPEGWSYFYDRVADSIAVLEPPEAATRI